MGYHQLVLCTAPLAQVTTTTAAAAVPTNNSGTGHSINVWIACIHNKSLALTVTHSPLMVGGVNVAAAVAIPVVLVILLLVIGVVVVGAVLLLLMKKGLG